MPIEINLPEIQILPRTLVKTDLTAKIKIKYFNNFIIHKIKSIYIVPIPL